MKNYDHISSADIGKLFMSTAGFIKNSDLSKFHQMIIVINFIFLNLLITFPIYQLHASFYNIEFSKKY